MYTAALRTTSLYKSTGPAAALLSADPGNRDVLLLLLSLLPADCFALRALLRIRRASAAVAGPYPTSASTLPAEMAQQCSSTGSSSSTSRGCDKCCWPAHKKHSSGGKHKEGQ
jgi:hypothetical protein